MRRDSPILYQSDRSSRGARAISRALDRFFLSRFSWRITVHAVCLRYFPSCWSNASCWFRSRIGTKCVVGFINHGRVIKLNIENTYISLYWTNRLEYISRIFGSLGANWQAKMWTHWACITVLAIAIISTAADGLSTTGQRGTYDVSPSWWSVCVFRLRMDIENATVPIEIKNL